MRFWMQFSNLKWHFVWFSLAFVVFSSNITRLGLFLFRLFPAAAEVKSSTATPRGGVKMCVRTWHRRNGQHPTKTESLNLIFLVTLLAETTNRAPAKMPYHQKSSNHLYSGAIFVLKKLIILEYLGRKRRRLTPLGRNCVWTLGCCGHVWRSTGWGVVKMQYIVVHTDCWWRFFFASTWACLNMLKNPPNHLIIFLNTHVNFVQKLKVWREFLGFEHAHRRTNLPEVQWQWHPR